MIGKVALSSLQASVKLRVIPRLNLSREFSDRFRSAEMTVNGYRLGKS